MQKICIGNSENKKVSWLQKEFSSYSNNRRTLNKNNEELFPPSIKMDKNSEVLKWGRMKENSQSHTWLTEMLNWQPFGSTLGCNLNFKIMYTLTQKFHFKEVVL